MSYVFSAIIDDNKYGTNISKMEEIFSILNIPVISVKKIHSGDMRICLLNICSDAILKDVCNTILDKHPNIKYVCLQSCIV